MKSLPGRGLGGDSEKSNSYTRQEQHIQQVLAVVSASISMLSGLISFYWFATMKRNFRHQLIMLLIGSGMFKAVWYWVPPITILAGLEPISHGFCQGVGFLLAVGIEASDSVIILIAIHTALTIFASRKANSQTGLYGYRWAAYTCWALFSTLMAALAFINPSSPYMSQGTFCYLPARPIWYRLALSWIPRYLILCTIVGIYLAVYLYTKSKFGDFDAKFSTNSVASEDTTQHSRTDRQPSWPLPGFDGADDPNSAESSTEISSPILGSLIASRKATEAEVSLPKSYEPVSGPRLTNRTPTLLEALRDRTLISDANKFVESSANAALRQRHKAIKRQLRYLFVYPLVYLAMWIPAFVSHCYLYTDQHNPPFVLNTISICFLCLQCAVDCFIFSIRETPWRQIKKNPNPIQRKTHSRGGSDNGLRRMISGFHEQATAKGDIQTLEGQTGQESRRERNWWDRDSM